MSERFVAKFSWSRPAALRLTRETGVLTALVRVPLVPLLPGAVASSTRPPLLITRRVPGSLCSRSSTRSTGSYRQTARVFLGGTAPVDSRERAEAAVGKLTGTQCRRPRPNTLRDRFGSWVRPDQRRALRAGASGRGRAGLWPTETLRPPLPGQQAAALQQSSMALTCLPGHGASLVLAAAIRASACSRQCDPARLGNAVSLTRRCLPLRPTAGQGAARVTGQGNRPGM